MNHHLIIDDYRVFWGFLWGWRGSRREKCGDWVGNVIWTVLCWSFLVLVQIFELCREARYWQDRGHLHRRHECPLSIVLEYRPLPILLVLHCKSKPLQDVIFLLHDMPPTILLKNQHEGSFYQILYPNLTISTVREIEIQASPQL